MIQPARIVWTHPKARYRRESAEVRRIRRRPFRVEYALAYDDGGGSFVQYYRTYFGGRWSAFWHIHVRSWGGTALMYEQRAD